MDTPTLTYSAFVYIRIYGAEGQRGKSEFSGAEEGLRADTAAAAGKTS